MSRVPVAVAAGLAGLAVYVGVVVAWADHVLPAHWAVQIVYFAITGTAWVVPIRWLMLWAARK